MTKVVIDQPGIFEATEDQYHADPLPEASLSSTLMKELLARTPLHAWTKSPRLNPYFEPTHKPQFDIGHAVHTVYTGTGASIHVIDAPAFTTKAAREERDLCYERGLTPLLAGQWARVKDMLEAGRQQLRANECGDVFDGGECEVNFAAQIGGVWNRCRIDCLDRENRVLYDLKTTGESADPDAFMRSICNFGYDIQAAHYTECVEAVLGRGWTFRFVVQEKAPPHGLTVIELSPVWLDLARRKTARARQMWAHCLNAGQWPGYPAKICILEAPNWHEAKWMDREIREDDYQRKTGLDVLEVGMKWQAPLPAAE